MTALQQLGILSLVAFGVAACDPEISEERQAVGGELGDTSLQVGGAVEQVAAAYAPKFQCMGQGFQPQELFVDRDPAGNDRLTVGGQQIRIPGAALAAGDDTVTFRMEVPAGDFLEVRVTAVNRASYSFAQPVELVMNFARCRNQQFGTDTIPFVHHEFNGGTETLPATKDANQPRVTVDVSRLSLFLLDVP